jgi:hypothetical protein
MPLQADHAQSQDDRRQGDGDHYRTDAEHVQSQSSAPSNRGEEVITYGSQAAHVTSSGIYVPKYSDTTRYFHLTPYPAVSVSEK